MYVDGLTTGCDRIEQAQTLFQLRSSEIMNSGGFAKKKVANNDPAAIADLPSEAVAPVEISPQPLLEPPG
ncbi:hypothetical protein T10_11216 [Trichinella papuae]|uniref:Uncharacterized protein n=1 Tax=Trichinella papuae TaxID=268474 RepID=A0A0V1MEJ3_9BILA|nr:hypothetical protein T10_11216 [Trichinella papuae]